MADVSVVVQRTTLPTSTGTHDVTVSGLGTAKAAIFIFYKDTGSAGTANQQDAVCGYGFTDGTNHYSVYGDWLNGTSSHNGERAQSTSYVALLEETAANNAAFNSWITDGVRLDVTNGSSIAGCHLDVVLFSGGDVNAAAGNFAVPGSSGSTRSVTGLSFAPNLVFAATAGIPTGTNQSHSVVSFGCAHDSAGGIVQSVLSRGAANNTKNLGVVRRNDGFCAQAFTQGTPWRQEVTSFNADGFTVTERDSNAGSDDVGFLAVDLGSHGVVLEPNYGTPTSTGTDTISSSFTPGFLLGVFSRRTSSANLTSTNSNDGEVIGHSLIDKSQSIYSQTQVDRGNSSTTVCAAYRSTGTTQSLRLFTDKTVNNVFDDNLLSQATFDSFSASGTVFDYSSVSGGGSGQSYYGWVLQIEEGVTTVPLDVDIEGTARSQGTPSLTRTAASEIEGTVRSQGTPSLTRTAASEVEGTVRSQGTPSLTRTAASEIEGTARSQGAPSLTRTAETSIEGTARSSGTPVAGQTVCASCQCVLTARSQGTPTTTASFVSVSFAGSSTSSGTFTAYIGGVVGVSFSALSSTTASVYIGATYVGPSSSRLVDVLSEGRISKILKEDRIIKVGKSQGRVIKVIK